MRYDDLFGKEEQKIKPNKIAKKRLCLGLATICTGLATCLMGMVAIFPADIHKSNAEEIANEQGYREANDAYLIEQTEEINQMLEDGKISRNEYSEKLERIKDLDVKKFMQENASEEALNDFMKSYNKGEKWHDMVAPLALSGFGIGLAGVIGTAISLDHLLSVEEKSKNRETKECKSKE